MNEKQKKLIELEALQAQKELLLEKIKFLYGKDSHENPTQKKTLIKETCNLLGSTIALINELKTSL